MPHERYGTIRRTLQSQRPLNVCLSQTGFFPSESLTRNNNITQYKYLAFHSLLMQMRDDYINSHYFTNAFVFKRLGECTKGVIL